jgi:cytochrome P450
MDKDVLHQGVFFALQSPKNVANPYPFYQKLRSQSPFYWDFVSSAWFLTRYSDVRAGLADQRLRTKNFPFDVTQLPSNLQNNLAPLARVAGKEVLHSDRGDHDRLRRPLNKAFQPGALEQLRPTLEALAQQLFANGERSGAMDLVADYCEPLADCLFAELLGLPRTDRRQVVAWCDDLRKFRMMPRKGLQTIVRAKIAVKSFGSLQTYLKSMIAVRRRKFADDVIGRSLAVEGDGARPSDDEIMANCVLFLHSGVRNMSASITNAVYVLLRHPRQFAALRDNPLSINIAVEELIRYEPPLQVVSRGVPEHIELAGRQIGPGQLVVLLLGAANRDPEEFDKPNHLDLTRRPNRHVSFGLGAHGCVGAWIARFGLNVTLGAILNRGTRLRLNGRKLQWNFPLIRRDLVALPVSVRPQRPSSTRKGPALKTLHAFEPQRIQG